MSDAVLKRKTRHIKVPISGRGKNGFSLNGGYRNRGAVGNTNLARSSTRTIFKGAFPVGSGGCCGDYVDNIITNNSHSTNDINIVKRSTMNTNGYTLATIKHPTSVFTDCSNSCVRNWVKDLNSLNYSQGMFIRTLKIKNVCPNWLEAIVKCNETVKCDPNCTDKSYFIGTKKVVRNTTTKTSHKGALDSSDYMSGVLHARQCLPPPPCKQSFPMTIRQHGCRTNYLTPEEAIAAGVLPEHWGHCVPHTHKIYQYNPYTSTYTIKVGPNGIYNPTGLTRWLSLKQLVEGILPGYPHHSWFHCWNSVEIKIITGGGGGGAWNGGPGGGGGQGTVGTFRIGINSTPGLELVGDANKLEDIKISIVRQKAGIQCAGGTGGSNGNNGQAGMYGWVQLYAANAAPFGEPIANIFLNGGMGGSRVSDASGGCPPPPLSQAVDWRYPAKTFLNYGGLNNSVLGRGNHLTGDPGNNPSPIIINQVVGGKGGKKQGDSGTDGGTGGIWITFSVE